MRACGCWGVWEGVGFMGDHACMHGCMAVRGLLCTSSHLLMHHLTLLMYCSHGLVHLVVLPSRADASSPVLPGCSIFTSWLPCTTSHFSCAAVYTQAGYHAPPHTFLVLQCIRKLATMHHLTLFLCCSVYASWLPCTTSHFSCAAVYTQAGYHAWRLRECHRGWVTRGGAQGAATKVPQRVAQTGSHITLVYPVPLSAASSVHFFCNFF